jgi:uncharacterized protein YaeQ
MPPMALAATLYDFQLTLSHVDRAIDQQLSFKVARHPSETLERVWLRVLAYCWQWDERLTFGPGLSDPDTPDLEARDYTGQVTRWIRVGKADPQKIQRAVDQNPHAKVAVLFEAPVRMQAFLAEAAVAKTSRVAKAELAAVDPELLSSLAAVDERRSKLTVTLVGDHFYLDRGGKSFDGPLTHGALGT